MSVELPEAVILAKQMQKTIIGKEIQNIVFQDCDKLQQIGFINKDLKDFDNLIRKTVQQIQTRGNVIRVECSDGFDLLLAPEYGGKLRYYPTRQALDEGSNYHMLIDFSDKSLFFVRLANMGLIYAVNRISLPNIYVYKRDFSSIASPIEKSEFTWEYFQEHLTQKRTMLKPLLVGKDAMIVGLGNSCFQEILYQAKLLPQRKSSDLSILEQKALYHAIIDTLQNRIQGGGKSGFSDLFGKPGLYVPSMGPNMKNEMCPQCHSKIQSMNHGGGVVFYCSTCQR